MIRGIVALLALVIALVAVNASILNKENHLDSGRTVILQLAPVDPRSLMQGDYMALRFEIASELRDALPKADRGAGWQPRVNAKDGWVVLELDQNNVGQFVGIADQPSAETAINNRVHMSFRVRSGTIKFATNAFFFEEGTAEIYEQARFGEFKVNANGAPLLVALLDQELKRLGSTQEVR